MDMIYAVDLMIILFLLALVMWDVIWPSVQP